MKLTLILILVTGAIALDLGSRREREFNPGLWWIKLEEEPTLEDTAGVSAPVATREEPAVINPVGLEERLGDGGSSSSNIGDDFSSAIDEKIVEEKIRKVSCEGVHTKCLPYYECEERNFVTDEPPLIDISIGGRIFNRHRGCPRYLDVCCKLPNISPVRPTIKRTPRCGRINSDGIHARINGLNETQTQVGEFPWMMAILKVEQIGVKEVYLYLCGGSLVQPNLVLTAAHCLRNFSPKSLKVRAGEWDTQTKYELYPYQDRRVSHVIVHPEYNAGSLWNDFALVILETPVDLAPNVDTICLPPPNAIFDNETCVATGWGKDRFGKKGRFQNILKKVVLNVIPNDQCQFALQTTRLGEHFILDKSFLCAGGKLGVDTCKGDGGSPLVCPRLIPDTGEVVYYHSGIVAWGIGCGEEGIPGVYADVTTALKWIAEAYIPYSKV